MLWTLTLAKSVTADQEKSFNLIPISLNRLKTYIIAWVSVHGSVGAAQVAHKQWQLCTPHTQFSFPFAQIFLFHTIVTLQKKQGIIENLTKLFAPAHRAFWNELPDSEKSKDLLEA